ncbi:MAG: molybdopterin-dependent oxidoreductase, partial [Rhabdaerophilum sp.]
GVTIGVIGERVDLSYPHAHLGAGPDALASIKLPEGAQKPMFIIGQGSLNRPDSAAVLATLAKLAVEHGVVKDGWNGFNILHAEAAMVGALDLGFVPGEGGLDTAAMLKSGALDVLFNLGADEVEIPAGAFVVYQGTHGDKGAHRADVILPGATYTEKSATYVNTEGRVQMTNRAVFPPGEAKEDWAIIRALSDVLGARLPYDSLNGLRAAIYADHPHFAGLDAITAGDASAISALAKAGGKVEKAAFVSPVSAFHLTNAIARASKVMGECASLAAGNTAIAAE